MDKRKMGIDYSPLNMPNARLIFNSPFSIFNLRSCQLDWPRSGERQAEERSEAAGASLSERSEFAARTA